MKAALLCLVVMAYLLADSTTAQGSTFEFKCGVDELKEDFISRMDNVEGNLNNVEGKLDSVEGKLNNVEGNLNNVEGKLDNVEGKLDSVEGKLEGKLDELQVQHQDLKGKIDRLATVMDGKLDDLKQLLEKVITSQYQPVDGGWTQWGTWSGCGSNCEHTRGRTCSNPAPSNGGSSCTGESDENEACAGGSCKKGEKLYASDGYSFFKTPVPYGTSMKNPAVSKTCIGAGMKSVCSFPKGCSHNSDSCRMTPLSTTPCGGSTMYPLSKLICNGKQAEACPQLEGMFCEFKQYNGDRGIVGGKSVWARIKADVYLVSKKETPYFAYCVL